MLATYDLAAVRRFTEELSAKRNQCDNGEGMICSNLQERIDYYVQLCQELRAGISQWARAVFTGQVPFDPKVEDLLKVELQRLLNPAKDVAALGRAWDERCFKLARLDYLHYCVMDIDYLLKNWVSPRLSTSPAPRTRLSEAAMQEARENLKRLSPLPSDWEPADPAQRDALRRERGESVQCSH
jgi:hypothetical protein